MAHQDVKLQPRRGEPQNLRIISLPFADDVVLLASSVSDQLDHQTDVVKRELSWKLGWQEALGSPASYVLWPPALGGGFLHLDSQIR